MNINISRLTNHEINRYQQKFFIHTSSTCSATSSHNLPRIISYAGVDNRGDLLMHHLINMIVTLTFKSNNTFDLTSFWQIIDVIWWWYFNQNQLFYMIYQFIEKSNISYYCDIIVLIKCFIWFFNKSINKMSHMIMRFLPKSNNSYDLCFSWLIKCITWYWCWYLYQMSHMIDRFID